ncbi:MAG: hypothetical protein IV105_06400 [Rhizobacter sp.]|nr:hypothetical protein [Rhizobacter sp.]
MNTLHRLLCLLALPLVGCATATPTQAANDFPTSQRVIYVQECMRTHPGPHFEMINKCSCAIDTMASEVRYEDFVGMSTVVNAMSIGGERGGSLRDNESIKPEIKRYRELEKKVHKACFINDAK